MPYALFFKWLELIALKIGAPKKCNPSFSSFDHEGVLGGKWEILSVKVGGGRETGGGRVRT